ncbi:hypothetical protein EDD37DRAFT_348518 [Exophiala viscosa]|uniref:uncharacterized protein n=1 Tax=Exophiala viscosa TaxID=2486360 RepID=UPI002199866E|nr:hypothetical protein EDD37DRAFT_348518 [Exophiala viscosa]
MRVVPLHHPGCSLFPLSTHLRVPFPSFNLCILFKVLILSQASCTLRLTKALAMGESLADFISIDGLPFHCACLLSVPMLCLASESLVEHPYRMMIQPMKLGVCCFCLSAFRKYSPGRNDQLQNETIIEARVCRISVIATGVRVAHMAWLQEEDSSATRPPDLQRNVEAAGGLTRRRRSAAFCR